MDEVALADVAVSTRVGSSQPAGAVAVGESVLGALMVETPESLAPPLALDRPAVGVGRFLGVALALSAPTAPLRLGDVGSDAYFFQN